MTNNPIAKLYTKMLKHAFQIQISTFNASAMEMLQATYLILL